MVTVNTVTRNPLFIFIILLFIGLIFSELVKKGIVSKKVAIITIKVIASITTLSALYIFVLLFFFIGFFNPIIFFGTVPFLFLLFFKEKSKKPKFIKRWIIYTAALYLVSSIVLTITAIATNNFGTF